MKGINSCIIEGKVLSVKGASLMIEAGKSADAVPVTAYGSQCSKGDTVRIVGYLAAFGGRMSVVAEYFKVMEAGKVNGKKG